jgi:asparagine synthase (glutamine-hydrolysing)
MCGIAGAYHYADPNRPVDRDLLARMTRVLAHRGPDDEGMHVEGPVGLGHRRLSIVDLTSTGHQPMTAAASQCWLTYNGEFYNHAGFRRRLEGRGIRFRGTSDTETLFHVLEQFGPGALSEAAGIFSLGFWDGRHRRLILARDPVGVKQLYYHDDGKRIVFASEIKALLQCSDVPRELDPAAVNQYLHFHTPLFDRTFFKDIKQVRAGEYLEVTGSGVHHRVYWDTDGFQPRQETPERSVEQLRQLLEQVTTEQLMSDVPVGAFFSGGIDSSAIAAFAARSGRPPRLFGVHFSNQGVIDERPYQKMAARALGLELELTTVDGAGFPQDLMTLIHSQDQPVIGAAMIPMYYVSKLAAGQVKVCLGGQAADEIFGGYARYAMVKPGHTIASLFSNGQSIPRSGVGQGTGSNVGSNLLKQLVDPRNLRRASRVLRLESWQTRYFENFAKVPEKSWQRVFAGAGMVSRAAARQIYDDTIARSPATDPGDKVLHWDMQTYLTGLFQQDDRMSMANSLESRVPFADPRVVRFAFHTAFDLKVRGGASKWILRQAVSDVLPAAVLSRRKVGFDTPAEAWMRGPHNGFVRDLLLSSRARERGFWDPHAVARTLDDTRSPYWFDVVWKLASIEAWASSFLDAPQTAPELTRQDAICQPA